jgi:predicted phosphodiesterase
MRVAVMSDVHGFSLALDVVLADIAARGPFDAVVIAGDICEVGPDPAGALERVRADEFMVVQGNTDRDVELAARGAFTSPELEFVLEEVGPEGAAWLGALPMTLRLTPPGGVSPDDDVFVCHANPHDLEQKMTPEMSDFDIREVLGGVTAAAVAFGHHHVAHIRELDDMLLVDVSAVGNPKDGDLRSAWGLLEWNVETRRWRAQVIRLPYPLAETEAQMRASGMPDPERAIRKLRRASYRRPLE